MSAERGERNCKIDRVDKTSETLTGRAGLAAFVVYLSSRNLPRMLAEQFSSLRTSSKGIGLWEAFEQLFCFFMDARQPRPEPPGRVGRRRGLRGHDRDLPR